MEDNPIWSKWSHNRHVPSKENSTTIDAKICQLGTDTRWHFGKFIIYSSIYWTCDPSPTVDQRAEPVLCPLIWTVFIKTPFRTNWHNFWDGKSNTTVLTHELLDAQDLRLVSNFYLIRAPWTRPSGHIFWNFTRISQENKMICSASKSSSVMKTLILDRVSILTVNYGRWPTNSELDDSPSVVYLAVSGLRVPSWDSQSLNIFSDKYKIAFPVVRSLNKKGARSEAQAAACKLILGERDVQNKDEQKPL